MACSTCHVVIDPVDFDKLPKATEPEEDMLDFAAGVRRTSRLACQVYLTDAMESLTVRMPGDVHNMRSEEHTSELQSLMRNSYAVFCLKKKRYNKTHMKILTLRQKEKNRNMHNQT